DRWDAGCAGRRGRRTRWRRRRVARGCARNLGNDRRDQHEGAKSKRPASRAHRFILYQRLRTGPERPCRRACARAALIYFARGGRDVEVIKQEVARALEELLRVRYKFTPGTMTVEYPPQSGMGDLASPVAFELAKTLRRPPRQIAQELAAAFPPLPGVARVDVGGAGYLNIFLDRGAAARALAREIAAPLRPAGGAGKIIVEHTNINPNKAAHIGHLRNAVLGDTLGRCLRFFGHPVEVQNYIDDTGVQVADIVIGFREIRKEGLKEA